MYVFIGEVPQHFSTHAYSILVFDIILLAATCPFTILLNVLTMIAVKIKARLQSMSNIALACLATTDAMVGILAQPVYIFLLIITLQGDTDSNACTVQNVSRYLMNFFCFSSIAHLVLLFVDRYMAINQSYTYDQTVTKARVLMASAIAWIFTAVVYILLFIDLNLFLKIQSSILVVFMVSITIFTFVVYREARRHERQIAAQQVSVEARERFLKEQRALKLTITIVIVVFLNYFPIINFRIIKAFLKGRLSTDTIYAVYLTAGSLILANSFVNPLIYSLRLRQFRVAFIEILLKKNHAVAEEIEKKMFGHRNAAPNVEVNQGGETEERNANQVNANINNEVNQGGERKEQNVDQVNSNIDNEINQGGEGEEQNVDQVIANIDNEIYQGVDGEKHDVNQVNENEL